MVTLHSSTGSLRVIITHFTSSRLTFNSEPSAGKDFETEIGNTGYQSHIPDVN